MELVSKRSELQARALLLAVTEMLLTAFGLIMLNDRALPYDSVTLLMMLLTMMLSTITSLIVSYIIECVMLTSSACEARSIPNSVDTVHASVHITCSELPVLHHMRDMSNKWGIPLFKICEASDSLSCSFEPMKREYMIDSMTLTSSTPQSIACACHEVGHAVQFLSPYEMRASSNMRLLRVSVVLQYASLTVIVLSPVVPHKIGCVFVIIGTLLLSLSALARYYLEQDASVKAYEYIAGTLRDDESNQLAHDSLDDALATYKSIAIGAVISLVSCVLIMIVRMLVGI